MQIPMLLGITIEQEAQDLVPQQTLCFTATETQTIESVLSELREIKLLQIRGISQPIGLRSDGTIESLDWENFLNPVRTKLSLEMSSEIPQSIYDLTFLRN